MNIEVVSQPAKTNKRGSIVFVHGVCHDAWCWHNYLDYFSEVGFDVYALSLRGHGKSDGSNELNQWGVSDYVTDVLKVIHSIGEKPTLVGHSMGGAIAQKIIGEHEECIKAAVLLAPAVAGGLTIRWKLKRFIVAFSKSIQFAKTVNKMNVTEQDVENGLFFDGRLSKDELIKIVPHLQAESKRAQNDLSRGYTPYYGSQKVPVMVIGSSNDLLFPSSDLEKTAQAYGVNAVILDDMCHDMQVDPDWLAGAVEIENFLQQLN